MDYKQYQSRYGQIFNAGKLLKLIKSDGITEMTVVRYWNHYGSDHVSVYEGDQEILRFVGADGYAVINHFGSDPFTSRPTLSPEGQDQFDDAVAMWATCVHDAEDEDYPDHLFLRDV